MSEDVQTQEAPAKVNPFAAEAEKANTERGDKKGTRLFTGFTRGKGSLPIKYENFDLSKTATLPASIAEFMELTGKKDEKDLLEYLIVGYNDDMYTKSSDPIAEHVNAEWDDDTQTQFRLVVRNLSKAMNTDIDKVVALVKPGVQAAFEAKRAAVKA